MRDWGAVLQIEEDIESKKATKFAWPEMVTQTQSTEILGVVRLDEKQWEVQRHMDAGSPYRGGAHKAHFPRGVTFSISACGLALINPLRIEMHGLLYSESYDPCSYFHAFATSCFESEAECSFPESFLSILLDLQRVIGLATLSSHPHSFGKAQSWGSLSLQE